MRQRVISICAYLVGLIWFLFSPLGTMTSMLAAFLLPTAILLTHFLLNQLHDTEAAHEADAIAAIQWRLSLYIMALHLLIIGCFLNLTSARLWGARLVMMLWGGLLISVGNLLPRTRPNLVIGIRTDRTLRSRSLWMHIHRVGGAATVMVGLVTVVAAVVFKGPRIAQAITVSVMIAATLVIQSYRSAIRDTEGT